jgi:starch-binding outer membrane protein, SusD/RagB family
MLGNSQAALDAANKVNLTVKSSFVYDAINQNPVFRVSLVTNNTYNGLPNFGLSGALLPDSLDGRIAYYLGTNVAPVKVAGFFKSDTDPIPVYLPGEMSLIKAEANARLNNVSASITELNKVRTKKDDIFGVNAKLSEYSGSQTAEALLNEIYKQRCIELYMSGMKLEDSRRFGRPGPGTSNAERNRNFYPYPTNERDNNPNTPDDPAI